MEKQSLEDALKAVEMVTTNGYLSRKGRVQVKNEFVHTTVWPSKFSTMHPNINMEEEYKKAMAGKILDVMDIAVDGGAYMVYAKSDIIGEFIWTIEKEDTYLFIKQELIDKCQGKDISSLLRAIKPLRKGE